MKKNLGDGWEHVSLIDVSSSCRDVWNAFQWWTRQVLDHRITELLLPRDWKCEKQRINSLITIKVSHHHDHPKRFGPNKLQELIL